MDKFLERLFPSETLEMELPISKQDFIKKFKEITTASDINFFSEVTEPFIYTKTKFIGNITSASSFEIKRYRRFFKNYQGKAVCYGTIKEDFERITIKCKIISFRSFTKYHLLFSFFIMLLWFTYLNTLGFYLSEVFIIIPIFLVFSFFGMRKIYSSSNKKLKNVLERNFHFFTIKE